jgi:hypothetical protein
MEFWRQSRIDFFVQASSRRLFHVLKYPGWRGETMPLFFARGKFCTGSLRFSMRLFAARDQGASGTSIFDAILAGSLD